MQFCVDYVRDDGREDFVFIEADDVAEARFAFTIDTGYPDNSILYCEEC